MKRHHSVRFYVWELLLDGSRQATYYSPIYFISKNIKTNSFYLRLVVGSRHLRQVVATLFIIKTDLFQFLFLFLSYIYIISKIFINFKLFSFGEGGHLCAQSCYPYLAQELFMHNLSLSSHSSH